MINYLSKFYYLSIKLITCQNKLIADQKMIDCMWPYPHNIATCVKQYESYFIDNLDTARMLYVGYSKFQQF